MSFCFFCVITILSRFSLIPNKEFCLSLVIPLVCTRRSIIATASRGVTWKNSCSSSMSSGSSSSSLSRSILYFLFTYSLRHSWVDADFQPTISEMIGGWKLEISLPKSIYSSAVKWFSASFISVSSLNSSAKSSSNSDASFSTTCCSMPHFAKQFLIAVSETSFQAAATRVIARSVNFFSNIRCSTIVWDPCNYKT